MVKVMDVRVGDVIDSRFDQITRNLLKNYAKASGDTNPVHTNDAIAEKAGLKGVIAHGLFSFGFISKLFEDYLNQEKEGKIIKIDIDMRGMVRVDDLLITEAEVTKIEGKRIYFDVKQTTITNIDIKKDGQIVKLFEAGERGYITDKDIARDLVKTKSVDEGILSYRERIATPGKAIIELFE